MGSLYGKSKYDLLWNETNGFGLIQFWNWKIWRCPDTVAKIEAYMQISNRTLLTIL